MTRHTGRSNGRRALARLCAALFFVTAVLGAGSALPKKLTDALPFGQALRSLTAQAAMPPGQASDQYEDMNDWWSLVLEEDGADVKATLYAGNLNITDGDPNTDITRYSVASGSNLTNADIDFDNLKSTLAFNAGEGARGLYSELTSATQIDSDWFQGKHLQIVIDGDVTVNSISMNSAKFETVSIRMAIKGYPVNAYTTNNTSSSLACEFIYFDGIPLYLDQAKITLNGSSSRDTTLTSAGLEILGGELEISSNARDCINSQRDIRITDAKVKVTNTSGHDGVTGIVAKYDPVTNDRASIFIDRSSEVTVTVQPGNQNMAIDAYKNVEISDTATVNATVSPGSGGNTNSVGICAGEDVIISGGMVTAEGDLAGIATGAPSGASGVGSFGFFASDPPGGSITISGGTTRATGTGVAYGIRAGSDVTIENVREVTATGNTIAGIAAQDNLSIGGAGKTTASSDTGTGLTAGNTLAINITDINAQVEAISSTGYMPVTAGGDVTLGDGAYETMGFRVENNPGGGGYSLPALGYGLNRGVFGKQTATFNYGKPVVIFDAQGGSVTPGRATVNKDNKLFELPLPTRDGHTFNGWFMQPAGTQVTTDTFFQAGTIPMYYTVYAQWTPVPVQSQEASAVSPLYYWFFAGNEQVWLKGSTAPAHFTVKRSMEDGKTFSLFRSVEIDGVSLDASQYSVAEGSVLLAVPAQLLETLPDGTHTIRVLFADGVAGASFTIASSVAPHNMTRVTPPQTAVSGEAAILLPGVLLVLSLAGLMLCIRRAGHFLVPY